MHNLLVFPDRLRPHQGGRVAGRRGGLGVVESVGTGLYVTTCEYRDRSHEKRRQLPAESCPRNDHSAGPARDCPELPSG